MKKMRTWCWAMVLLLSAGIVLGGCTKIPANPAGGDDLTENNGGGNEDGGGGGGDNNVTEAVELSQTFLAGLPGQSYSVSVTNREDEEVEISYTEQSWFTAEVTDDGQILIAFTAEGQATVTVSMEGYTSASLSVHALDLDFDMDEHIDVDEAEPLKLTHDVDADYVLQGTCAVIEDGKIKPNEEGVFYVTATYGEIEITKMFESFSEYPSELSELPRESVYTEYHGRNVHLGGSVLMNNIGSGFTVRFFGTRLSAEFDAWYGSWYGKTMLSVLVDGETDTTKNIVTLESLRQEYTLVTGLEEGMHTVTVLKRTEALSTDLTLYSVKTDGTFHPIPEKPTLKLEAYGDSITAGYGNLRGDLADTTSSAYQSGLQTWATYAAKELGAEINVQAKTGIGLYRSGGSEENQVEDHYDCVNYDGEYEWNFENYTPDIVLINLGTNDNWSVGFDKSTFVAKYTQFVTKLAATYGEQTAFILVSGFMERDVDAYVQEVAAALDSEIENPVYTIQFDQCKAGHPVWQEHLAAGQDLAQFIRARGLDVIRGSEEEVYTPSAAGGGEVQFTFGVRTRDIIPEHVSLYAVGLDDDPVELTRSPEDRFIFSAKLTLAEGDRSVRILAENSEDYKEYADVGNAAHTVYVRSDHVSQQISLNTFRALPAGPDPAEATSGWQLSKHLFDASFTASSAETLEYTNANWLAGFLTHRATIGDEYTVSAHLEWTSAGNAPDQVHVGLVPYYLDDHNYVVIYLQWNADGSFKNIGCTGELGGDDISWHDFGSFATLDLKHTSGAVDISVTRRGTELTIGMSDIKATQTIDSRMAQDTLRYGVWVHNATVSCTEVKAEEAVPDRTEETFGWQLSNHLYDASFTASSAETLEYTNANWLAGFLTHETTIGDEYTVSAHLEWTGSSTANQVYVGLVPYYRDDQNYVVTYLQWNEDGSFKGIGCTGLLGGNDIGWHDFWSFNTLALQHTSGEADISVTRRGTALTIEMSGVQEKQTIDARMAQDTLRYGVWVQNVTATCERIKATAAAPEVDTNKWEATGNAQLNVLDNTHIQVTNNDWMGGYVLGKADYADNFTFSAKITAPQDGYNDGDHQIGFLPYYVDSNNYIVIYLQWNDGKIKSIGCTGRIDGANLDCDDGNGEWHDMWAFENRESKLVEGQTLTVTRTGNKLIVTFDGVEATRTINNLASVQVGQIGFWARAGEDMIEFSEISFTQYSAE